MQDDYTPASPRTADYDATKYFLGKLCIRGHDFNESGLSLRYAGKRYRVCVECERLRMRNRDRSADAVRIETQRFTSMRRNNRSTGRDQEKYTLAQLNAHLERFGGSCAYCGASVLPCEHCGSTLLQWDHFDPEGPDALANLVPACKRCNLSKLNRSIDEWFQAQPFYTRVRDAVIREVLATANSAADATMRWSRKHDQCGECGTTERPHMAQGMCARCYQRLVILPRRPGYRPRRKAAAPPPLAVR